MISRRSFLKSIGVAAAALGSGIGAGKFLNSKSGRSFLVHGFLPANEKLISETVEAFVKKVGNSSHAVIFADDKLKNIISSSYNSAKVNNSFFEKGKVTFRLIKMNRNVPGDILLTDNNISVYDPKEDFTGAFIYLRQKLQNEKAEYFFTAEYSENDLISNLIAGNNRSVIIENEKGIVEKINLKENYKNIFVAGPQGKTGLKIENGFVHVHTSTCKHGICKQSGFASKVGDLIACAPNKVLIRIEAA